MIRNAMMKGSGRQGARRRALLGAACAALLCAAPASGQAIELGGSLGEYGFVGDDFFDQKSSTGFEGTAHYLLSDHLELGGGVLFIDLDIIDILPHVDHLEVFAEPRLRFAPGLGPLETVFGLRGGYVRERLHLNGFDLETTGFIVGLTGALNLPLHEIDAPYLGRVLDVLSFHASGLVQSVELGDRMENAIVARESDTSGGIVAGRIGFSIRWPPR